MSKTTYIIGAGFSRYAKLPLMNDFYFMSKDIYTRLDNDEIRKSFQIVFKYFDEFSKVKNIMEADFYNIEELLSIIEMDSFLLRKKNSKDYLLFLQKVIEYSSPQKIDEEGYYIIDNDNNSEIYTSFLMNVYGINKTNLKSGDNYFQRINNDNGIISLNYDLMLEKALYRLNIFNKQLYGKNDCFDFNYGLDDSYINHIYTNTPRFPKLKLAKIHGSINFIDNKSPLIIPPTWNKISNKKMIKVWNLAYNILSQSEEIIFIGYSLPETDLYVKYLLISGVKKCYNLKKVTVICPDEDFMIRKRYEHFFDENFRNKAFDFVPKTFENWFGIPKRSSTIRYLK
ncbi:MAG: hypothetical protein WC879_06415 [Melioribacteraceae bacterium]